MKSYPSIILLILLLPTVNFAQSCIPDSPVEIKKENLSEKNIKEKIEKYDIVFTEGKVEKVHERMINCNSKFAQDLNGVSDLIEYYSLLRKDIITYRNLEGLKSQLDEQIKSKGKIKDGLKNDFAKKERKGLFIVLIIIC